MKALRNVKILDVVDRRKTNRQAIFRKSRPIVVFFGVL